MSLNGKHTFNSVPDIPQLCELKIASEIRINYDITLSRHTIAMHLPLKAMKITKNSRAVDFL